MVNRQGRLPHPLFPRGGDGGGADLLCRAGLILVFIIIKSLFGDNLNGGQRLSGQNGHLNLPAGHILLQHALAAEAESLHQGPVELLPGVGDGHADGRTAGHRLHHAGHLGGCGQVLHLLFGVAHPLPLGGMHP